MNLKEVAKKLKLELPALLYALKHPKTGWLAKVLAMITLGYALSPIDLIPDFIPVLGYLDDLLILPCLLYLTIKCIPDQIMQECRNQVNLSSSMKLSKKWVYALPIIFIWLVLAICLIRTII